MCDWNLGKTGQVSAVELAYRCGLDGVEASVNFPDGGGGLRSPEELRGYRQACHRYGIEVPSVAMGILNSVPLKSEPKTALWVADAIAVGEKLGATCMLLAFFGPGELDMGDATSIGRVVDVLKELAPRAAAAGVSLGLENYLSAEDNLTLLDRVGSPAVQVYYDVRNSADKGRDPAKELRALKGRVCQVHLKNGDRLLSEKGEVDFAACAQALKETDYDGWLVLETASPSGSIVEDTKRNIAYIRSVF
jgi:sugar phosphate isomerase/epimerase